MDCDQFHVDDGAVLNVEDLHMLRGYDSKSYNHKQKLQVQSVEDRKNNLQIKCPRDFGIGPDHRYAGYPYRVIGGTPQASVVPLPVAPVLPVAQCQNCGNVGNLQARDEKLTMFFFVILVLVAFCVYLARSIVDLKEYIKEKIQKT